MDDQEERISALEKRIALLEEQVEQLQDWAEEDSEPQPVNVTVHRHPAREEYIGSFFGL